MSTQTWTYLLVGLTFLVYIIIAIVARAGSTKEFYVAGGGVNPIANGMATKLNLNQVMKMHLEFLDLSNGKRSLVFS